MPHTARLTCRAFPAFWKGRWIMIKLTLKDGSIRELEAPTAAAEVIKGIGMGLYKASCCVKLDGEV